MTSLLTPFLEWLARLDAKIFYLINHQLTFSRLDAIFTALTNLHHQPLFAYGLAPILLLWWGWRHRGYAIKVLVVLGMVAALCDSLSYRVIKPTVGRLRPHQAVARHKAVTQSQRGGQLQGGVSPQGGTSPQGGSQTRSDSAPWDEARFLLAPPEVRVPYPPKSLSFPSNHAVSGFALARILTWYHPLALWAWPLAALIAYSRVYVGVHYPSDVVGGALLGLLIATLLIRLVFRRFYFLLPFHEGGGYRTRRKGLR